MHARGLSQPRALKVCRTNTGSAAALAAWFTPRASTWLPWLPSLCAEGTPGGLRGPAVSRRALVLPVPSVSDGLLLQPFPSSFSQVEVFLASFLGGPLQGRLAVTHFALRCVAACGSPHFGGPDAPANTRSWEGGPAAAAGKALSRGWKRWPTGGDVRRDLEHCDVTARNSSVGWKDTFRRLRAVFKGARKAFRTYYTSRTFVCSDVVEPAEGFVRGNIVTESVFAFPWKEIEFLFNSY